MRIQKNFKVPTPNEMTLIDFLSEKVPQLSKQKIKQVLNVGGVSRKGKRLRRAQLVLTPEDLIEFNYDDKISFPEFENPISILELREFGIWYKPAGIMSQGNEFGDSGSMLRALEKIHKDVYLIHRLDRETAGLMVFAYNSKMAGRLSKMFQEKKIQKFYRAIVRGEAINAEIKTPLDGKEAHTTIKKLEFNGDISLVEVQIHTGRTHQIRRHLDEVGTPVIGDPKYGEGNKNKDGLKLIASRLIIPDFKIDISLPAEYDLKLS